MKRTGLDTGKRNRSGVPDPKKLEKTGDNTFVVHADGGNYFEGVIKDPSNVKMKDVNGGGLGRELFFEVGICLKNCCNKGIKCDNCVRFSELVEVGKNACVAMSK